MAVKVLGIDDVTLERAAMTYGSGMQESSGELSVNDSEVDHDLLLNFAANEHYTQANITAVLNGITNL